MAVSVACESFSQRRVLPSMSVNRKVTVPLGKSRMKAELATSWLRAMDRRAALAAALGGATVLALPYRASAGRVFFQRGMVGGGLAKFGEGTAHFSLFASRFDVDWGSDKIVVGS